MNSVGEKATYQGATTKTRMERGKGFQCQSGGASGLCPQPAAFVLVLEALSREFRVGMPVELFNADDLVVAETIQGIAAKKVWK